MERSRSNAPGWRRVLRDRLLFPLLLFYLGVLMLAVVAGLTVSPSRRGFGVLAASTVKGLIHMGTLSGFAFVWAMLADFLFAPALRLLVRPLGREREAPG